MPQEGNDRREQGIFEGEMKARLAMMERNCAVNMDNMTQTWEKNNERIMAKLDGMDEKITALRVQAGIGKGLVSIIAVFVSGFVSLLVSWVKSK